MIARLLVFVAFLLATACTGLTEAGRRVAIVDAPPAGCLELAPVEIRNYCSNPSRSPIETQSLRLNCKKRLPVSLRNSAGEAGADTLMIGDSSYDDEGFIFGNAKAWRCAAEPTPVVESLPVQTVAEADAPLVQKPAPPLVVAPQDEAAGTRWGFGVAVSGDTTTPGGLRFNGLRVPVLASLGTKSHFLRIEPELQFFQERDPDDNTTQLGVGLGVHYQYLADDTGLGIGVRAVLNRLTFGDDADPASSYSVGPVASGEYFFSPRFSAGFETQLRHDRGSDFFDEGSQFALEAGLLLRVYSGAR